MSDITISNADWNIIQSLKTVLQAATLESAPVFKDTFICLNERELDGKFLSGDVPRAIVFYETTSETQGVEDQADCVVHAEIVVIDKVSPSNDSSQRIRRGLELKNGAVNAINSAVIAQAQGVGGAQVYHPCITWGKTRLAVLENQGPPWVICRIKFEAAYSLENGTSH